MICFASYEELTAHVQLRSAEYLQDLEGIIVRRDERGIHYDTSLPAYQEMLRKYRPSRNGHRVNNNRRASEFLWQTWREQEGRWVAEGWIKPGFYADPPGFGPLPSERLKTPGFPAADFAVPTPTDPVDVVIPLGTGSKHQDEELRYALRSIERFVENLGRVWIVGHKPAWVQGVEHIPAGDPSRSKDANILDKIEAACRAGVSEKFLRWSDDQIALRPLAWSQFGPYCFGDLAGTPPNGKRWRNRQLATRDWLAARGLPTWHCDTHTPIPMERRKFLKLAEAGRDCWTVGDGVTVGTWYCNQAGQPRPLGDHKATLTAALPSLRLRAELAGRWFVGHNDPGFSGELRGLLDEIFPEPSGFEREPTIRAKPAGPTLSIIVPTIGRPTLKRTLESIRGQQLVDGDEVVVVQDGPPDDETSRIFKQSGLPGRDLAVGHRAADFGGTPRNLGMVHASGDYLAFIDDDDTYRPGAFAAIRKAITRHPGRPLMFRVYVTGRKETIWQDKTVRPANVGTHMIVTPNRPNLLGEWGRHRGSDFAFVVSTLRRWPPGSLVWCPEIIQSYLEPGFTRNDIGQATVRRNLLYHVYPVAANDEWKLNIERLRQYWGVFTGRKVVGIVTDASTVPVETVQAAFPDEDIEWLITPNDPELGEMLTFAEGLRRLSSLDAFEATFYAHAKGVVRACAGSKYPRELVIASVRRWRNAMYDYCLGHDAKALDWILKTRPCAGCFLWPGNLDRHSTPADPPSYWHYSGTFFWFNHAHFFGHPLALKLRGNRWGAEYHLGTLFAQGDAHCFKRTLREYRGKFYGLSDAQWDEIIA